MAEQFANQRTHHKILSICNLFLVSPVTAITGRKAMVNIYFCIRSCWQHCLVIFWIMALGMH